MINYLPEAKRLETTPFSIPKNFPKFDVPIGTEVFLAANGQNQTESKPARTTAGNVLL